ncbi:MAG: hypothetical protein EXX96DRAFT_552813 [Benjaminiella poitrasii]|nr:MAG: hypothetical protein EXX96DRAFT_552813 [Benjaminiella poitrasii]
MTPPSCFNQRQEQRPTLPSIVNILSHQEEYNSNRQEYRPLHYDYTLYQSSNYKELNNNVLTKRSLSSTLIKRTSHSPISKNDRTTRKQPTEQKKKRKCSKQNKCHSCQSTETPEWRKGPLGPRTLCNACGLIWTKLCKQSSLDKDTQSTTTVTIAASSPSPSPITGHNNNSQEQNNNKYELSFLLT